MTVKRVLKAVTPPVLVSPLRWLRDTVARRPCQPKWEYSPEGWRHQGVSPFNDQLVQDLHRAVWEGWLRAVSGPGPLGVDYFRSLRGFEELGQKQVHREMPWAHNSVMAYAYALALTSRHKDAISVLDWGGGIGQFYPLSRSLLPEVQLEYHSRDVPVLCSLGRDLNPDVTFHDDDESWLSRKYDLVLSSSAFQFEKEWGSLLAKLASVTGRYLFISRLPIISQSESFVVVQHSTAHDFPIEFCGWYLNRSEFLARGTGNGLSLRREFVMLDETPAHGVPEQAAYRGFLFERR